jgi:hypothetical protein
MIELDIFLRELKDSLIREKLAVSSIKISPHQAGSVDVTINGEKCLTSINIWPNRCFEVSYISLPSEKETITDRELLPTDDAVEVFLHEIRLAIERNKTT